MEIISALVSCWACHKQIAVSRWTDRPWAKEPPKGEYPKSIQFRRSAQVKDGYWANVCPHCNKIQGDFFLWFTPDGPFFDIGSQIVRERPANTITTSAMLDIFFGHDGDSRRKTGH